MSELFNKELLTELVRIAQLQSADPLDLARILVTNLQNQIVGTRFTTGKDESLHINFRDLTNLDTFIDFIHNKNVMYGGVGENTGDLLVLLPEAYNTIPENDPRRQLYAEYKGKGGTLFVNLHGLGAYMQSLYNQADATGGVNGNMMKARLDELQNEMLQKGLISKKVDLSGKHPEEPAEKGKSGPEAGAFEKTQYTPGQASEQQAQPGQLPPQTQQGAAEAFKESNPAGSSELVVPFVGNMFSIQRITNFGTQIGKLITNPRFANQLDLANDSNIIGQSVNQLSALITQWNQVAPQANKAGFMLPTDLESISQHLNAASSASYQMMNMARDMVNQILAIYETLLQNNIFASLVGPQIRNQMIIGHNLVVKFDDWAGSFRQKAPF